MGYIAQDATKTFSMFKLLETIPEIFAWVQIAIAPTLAGGILGAFCYFLLGGLLGTILCALLVSCGLVAGIIWANRVKKKGTVNFMARVNATPELDSDRP